jgi:hypothetical protein
MKAKPETKVTQSTLFVVQWRYCGKWIPVEVYVTIGDALRALRERRAKCPPDRVKRFRLVKESHWEQKKTIHKTTILPA